MAEQAVDFSNARIAPHMLRAAGVTTVFRYLGPSYWPKALTAAEAQTYLAGGVKIALNYEAAANGALQGATQGHADAVAANGFADAVTAPRNVPIFYSVDTAASYSEVFPYFQAAHAVGVRAVGFYGGLQVGLQLKAAGLVSYVWVANAASWSGYGNWTAMQTAAVAQGAHVLQHLDHPLVGLDPLAYDYDEILRPFPRWGDPPPVPPKPKVEAMYNPALHLEPIVADCARPRGGAWLVAADGSVYGFGGAPYRGGANGKPFFVGRAAARIEAGPKEDGYTIIDTAGERYSFPV